MSQTTNNNNQAAFVTQNRKEASQLVTQENALIKFVTNPNTGKMFFTCGKVQGYVSPAAQKAAAEHKPIEEFHYAEIVSINGELCKDQEGNPKPMPILMVVGKGNQNVVHSVGQNLLR